MPKQDPRREMIPPDRRNALELLVEAFYMISNQQARRLLARRQIDYQPAHDSLRNVVARATPNLRRAADFQCQVEDAIFQVLDPVGIGNRTTIENRHTPGGRAIVSISRR